MVPSALRTLSVVTLLSAVSGTVFLVSDRGVDSAAASINQSADSTAGFGGGSGSLAAAAADLRSIPAQRRPIASIQDQRHSAATEQLALRAAATAKAQALAKAEAAEAKAKAKARAEAAAERRRKEAVERASRSARRDPQQIARIMASERGWDAGQFSCLRSLWTRESGWNYRATNSSSGAYGIAQALPGSKMASAGSDWRTNPVTQIAWGLDYIADRYGTPCGAWAHSESSGWY